MADDPEIVLGIEYAAARDAEERHARNRPPSALSGWEYEARDHDLVRFEEVEIDGRLDNFLTDSALSPEELSMDDFYTLLAYAKRCGVRALRGNPEVLGLGVSAVACIDLTRIDPRDAHWSLGVVTAVARELGVDLEDSFAEELAQTSSGDMERLLHRFSAPASDGGSLEDWGFTIVDTAKGPGLARFGYEAFDPTVNLLDRGLAIASVLEADRYSLKYFEVGHRIAPIWLPGARTDEAEALLDRIRAGLLVACRLDPDIDPSGAQMMNVYLLEAASAGDADLVAGWSKEGKASHASLSEATANLVAVMIARSTVVGVEGYESDQTLARFREGLADALRE